MAIFISLVLGKDAPQVNRARFGRAIELLASSALQFLLAHGHARGIGTDIEDGHRLALRQRPGGTALLPLLGRRSNVLYRALDLSGRNADAARFPQMLLSFLIAGFIGSFQANQSQQCGCFASFDAQGGIRRVMTNAFARVVIVIPLQDKGAEDAIDRERLPPLALFSGFGLVGGLDLLAAVCSRNPTRAVAGLNMAVRTSTSSCCTRHPQGGGLESGYELLDFLFLGQEDLRGEGFFLEPAAMAARVWVITSSAYCSVRAWNCLYPSMACLDSRDLLAGNVAGQVFAIFTCLELIKWTGSTFLDDGELAPLHGLDLGDLLKEAGGRELE